MGECKTVVVLLKSRLSFDPVLRVLDVTAFLEPADLFFFCFFL